MKDTYYRERLSLPDFRQFISEIIKDSIDAEKHFDAAYTLVLNDTDVVMVYRATYLCRKITELHPYLLMGKEQELITQIMQQSNSGTRRMMLSMLNDCTFQSPIPIDFLDYCFDRMFALQEPPAVQALCVKLAYKLCCLEPELKPELTLYLENIELSFLAPAVRSTVRNTLKALKKVSVNRRKRIKTGNR